MRGRGETDARDEVMDLRTLPKVMMPMHCTGRNFIARMRTEMPDRLID